MDVHPSFTVNPPGPTTDEPFATEALYELKIDTDGDVLADIAYQVRFKAAEGKTQTATLRRLEEGQAAATAFLTVITNGKVTGDGIGPHGDLPHEFPYLGPPHTNRSTGPRLLVP